MGAGELGEKQILNNKPVCGSVQNRLLTYGKPTTIYNSLYFQLANPGGGLLYRIRPIQERLGENIKQNIKQRIT